MCCLADRLLPGKAPSIDLGQYNGNGLDMDDILERRSLLRQLNQTKDIHSCAGCGNLVKQEWHNPSAPFSIITVNASSICNLACSYCHTSNQSVKPEPTGYDIPELFTYMADSGLMAGDATVVWGGGEPTITQGFDSALSLLREKGINQVVCTNGVKFSNPLARELALTDRISLIVSVDAGNRETYCRIKGKDRFKEVWDHIGRYAAVGKVCVKYILYSQNNDEENILRFLNLCRTRGIHKVMLSTENKELNTGTVSEATVNAAGRFIKMATELGLTMDTQFFSTVGERG
ncbi:MAG: radical SAM protein [Desulfobacter sp.]|nr:MAG: radical SAM protein [Desulfobacter sp.]